MTGQTAKETRLLEVIEMLEKKLSKAVNTIQDLNHQLLEKKKPAGPGKDHAQYLKKNQTIINNLKMIKNNSFANSLINWVESGKFWSKKQYFHAARLAVTTPEKK